MATRVNNLRRHDDPGFESAQTKIFFAGLIEATYFLIEYVSQIKADNE